MGKDGDLLVQNKQLVIGDTTNQEIGLIVLLNKGEHKFEPLLGVEAKRLIKSRVNATRIKRDVNEELKKDGFKVIKTEVEWPTLHIDAKR